MKRRAAAGYTIVEVMIFLAISAGLFISTFAMVGARQGREEFTQGIQALDGKLRTTINEVGTGFYPRTSGYRCEALGTSAPSFTNATGKEGANTNCVVIGKVIQVTETELTIYTLVGRRLNDSGKQIQSVVESKPLVADNAIYNAPTLTEHVKYGYGMKVSTVNKAKSIGDGNIPATTFGFFASLAGYNGNDLVSGSQNVSFGTLRGIDTFPLATGGAISAINGYLNASNPFPSSGGVVICLVGATNEVAQLTIGANNRSLQTEVIRNAGTLC